MHGPLRKRRGRKRRLVRRLREAVKLFACPVRRHPAMATAEQKLRVSEFTNEPFVDFSKAENRKAMEEDVDTAETIDFCEFYGREMLRLAGPQKLTPMKGEKNYLVYIPLGVGAIIPPWNFPCAIMGGLVAASLVTGNTVVLKPASDSPTIAAKFVEILFEAGIPKEALNFVTGPGGSIGDALIAHPKTRYIGFTGSKEVGLRISELAGKAAPGQIWIKRTVLEMGGKDSIIVDDEADLDAAAEGVVQWAFGYQA